MTKTNKPLSRAMAFTLTLALFLTTAFGGLGFLGINPDGGAVEAYAAAPDTVTAEKYYSSVNIYANGLPIILKEGLTEVNGTTSTCIYLDKGVIGEFDDEDTLVEPTLQGEASLQGTSQGGFDLSGSAIYGGSKTDVITSNTSIAMTGGYVKNVYGGGLGMTATVSGDTKIEISGGTVGSVYGGGEYSTATVSGDTKVEISGGAVGSVYGGGSSGAVSGSAVVNISGGTVSVVYGGGNSGAVSGDTKVEISGGIVSYVYGGGVDTDAVVSGSAVVSISGGAVKGCVYGGGKYGAVSGDAVVSISGGVVEEVYGGGKDGAVSGSAVVNISGNAKITGGFGDAAGDVYGGGSSMSATVSGDTKVEISGGTVGKVYGGGVSGAVSGDTKVEISGGTVSQSVYGGGNNGAVSGGAVVNISGGTIEKFVYGGGNIGAVSGDTKVEISGGTVSGSVYGGGQYGVVSSTAVEISGGTVSSDVYGGGADGAVSGGAVVNISGGTVTNVNNGKIKDGASVSAITISGGSITNNKTGVTPTNGSGRPVYKTEIALQDIKAAPISGGTAVTAIDGASTYGMTGVKTDAAGKVYVFLAKDTSIATVTAGSITYTTTSGLVVAENDSNKGVFKKADPAAGAKAELAKITGIDTAELTFGTTDDKNNAEAKILELAQAKVAFGYTVTIASGSYTSPTWTGRFKVTENSTPANTATDASDRTITVSIVTIVDAATPIFTKDLSTTEVVYTVGDTAPTVKDLTIQAAISDSASGGDMTYQWYTNPANSNTGGTPVATGGTSSVYTPLTSVARTTYYYCVVTNTNNTVNGTKTVTATSKVACIKVIAPPDQAATPVITKNLSDAQYNKGAAATLDATATVTDGGDLSYVWYTNTVNSKDGSQAAGATDPVYTVPTNAVGTAYYYCVVTNTNEKATTTKTAVTTTNIAKITVVEGGGSNGGGHHSGGSSTASSTTGTVSKTDDTKTAEKANKGDVTFSTSKPKTGDKVVITIKPDVSYVNGKPVVKDKDGNTVKVTANADGTYSFVMPAGNVTVDAQFDPIFGDKKTTPVFKRSMASKQKTTLNGKELAVAAYNVDGYNYAKLRDIASVLNGTSAKFAVEAGTGNTIIVTPKTSYTPVGGELELGADLSSTCVVSKWTITIDGVARYLDVYNIGGNNYFKLRDLGELLSFGVDYDQATNTAVITAK